MAFKYDTRALPIEEQASKTLAKALTLIECFTLQNSRWGVRALARQVGMNITTVHRLLATFESFGYLEKDPEANLYALGPRVLRLAYLYDLRNPLQTVAREVFKQYIDQWPYNFYLAILRGFTAYYVVEVAGKSPVQISVTVGEGTGLHGTALGKVLLAFNDPALIEEYIRTVGLDQYTPLTLTRPEELRAELERVRQNGYSINRGEALDSVAGLGAPVFGRNGELLAAVSLAYPKLQGIADEEYSETVQTAIALAVESSRAIMQRLSTLGS